jgi:hypothetical protein
MELVTLPAPSAHDLGIRAGNGHPLRMRTAGESFSELTAGNCGGGGFGDLGCGRSRQKSGGIRVGPPRWRDIQPSMEQLCSNQRLQWTSACFFPPLRTGINRWSRRQDDD